MNASGQVNNNNAVYGNGVAPDLVLSISIQISSIFPAGIES